MLRDLSTAPEEKDEEEQTPTSKWLLSGVVITMSELMAGVEFTICQHFVISHSRLYGVLFDACWWNMKL